jgi:hypothetical protein
LILDGRTVQDAPDNVIPNTGQITHTPAADEDE